MHYTKNARNVKILSFVRLIIPLVLQFLVVPPHQVTTDVSLEVGHDLGQTLVTHILKHTQHTSPEEDLGVTQTVVISIELQSGQNLLGNNLAIDKGTLWDGVGSQDGVSAGDKGNKTQTTKSYCVSCT